MSCCHLRGRQGARPTSPYVAASVTGPASPPVMSYLFIIRVSSSLSFSIRDVVTFLCTGLPFCGPHGLPSPRRQSSAPAPSILHSGAQHPSVRAPVVHLLGRGGRPMSLHCSVLRARARPALPTAGCSLASPKTLGPGGGPRHTASRPQLARAV